MQLPASTRAPAARAPLGRLLDEPRLADAGLAAQEHHGGVPATALSSALVIVASSVSRPTNNGLTRSRRIPGASFQFREMLRPG
jgi:hypothetical protein